MSAPQKRRTTTRSRSINPVLQAEPALIGLDVPALPEVIAPAAMPKPTAPLVIVIISPSVAKPDDFDELFPDEGGETDVTGAFDDAYSAAPAAVVPKAAAPLFIDLPAPAVAHEPAPAALLVVSPVAPAVVPEPAEQHEHAHDDTDPFELHDGVLHAHDGDPDAQWVASVWAIGMSNLRADGDNNENEALLLAARPENEALLLAAGDAPLLPENEAPLLAAGDALLLPENESLLLAAGDGSLLPENKSLLLAAGDAPLLPGYESLLLAAGDALLLPENEALLLAAGDAPLLPESETLLLAAGDAPLLPENEALLLAAGDAPLLPENKALLLAAGNAPPLPTEESALLVGDVDALHVSGENMLGAGAALRRVAVVPPKLIVALDVPVLAAPLGPFVAELDGPEPDVDDLLVPTNRSRRANATWNVVVESMCEDSAWRQSEAPPRARPCP